MQLQKHEDDRGSFVELFHNAGGQVSFSTSAPGVTRGNHVHFRKSEQFVVICGSAIIRLRHIDSDSTTEYNVNGDKPTTVHIPPRYVHNITNVGDDTMFLAIHCDEQFDSLNPDTKMERVELEGIDGSWHASRDYSDITNPQET